MLYGKLIRSTEAHARIIKIDTSEAEKLPGVKAIITAKDVPSIKYGLSPARYDENIFASTKSDIMEIKLAQSARLMKKLSIKP